MHTDNKAKGFKTYFLESLGLSVTRSRAHAVGNRGSSSRNRGSLRNNGFMLNGSWSHDSIHNPVSNRIPSTPSHTYSYQNEQHIITNQTTQTYQRQYSCKKADIPSAMVETIPLRWGWAVAGGGACFTETHIKKKTSQLHNKDKLTDGLLIKKIRKWNSPVWGGGGLCARAGAGRAR